MAGMLDALKGVAAIGTDAVAAGKDIGAKTKMVNDYKSASATPVTSAPKPPKPAPTNPGGGKYGDRPGEKRIDTSQMTKPLGSYKKGGKVKKTGLYKLHKGERVLNAKQTKKVGGKLSALAGKK